MNKRALGAAGETAALKSYLEQGYCLIARNWHYKRFGEIDLILSHIDSLNGNSDAFLVFCEVKLRQEKSLLMPAESVNVTKQNRIRKLAEVFISLNPQYENHIIRFDVAEIYCDESKNYRIKILKEAF